MGDFVTIMQEALGMISQCHKKKQTTPIITIYIAMFFKHIHSSVLWIFTCNFWPLSLNPTVSFCKIIAKHSDVSWTFKCGETVLAMSNDKSSQSSCYPFPKTTFTAGRGLLLTPAHGQVNLEVELFKQGFNLRITWQPICMSILFSKENQKKKKISLQVCHLICFVPTFL